MVFELSYVKREANIVAHDLAKFASISCLNVLGCTKPLNVFSKVFSMTVMLTFNIGTELAAKHCIEHPGVISHIAIILGTKPPT